AFGELARPPGRDDVSLSFEEPGGSLAEGGGFGVGSGKLLDFGEIQQTIALQVKLVRGLDERRRRREQRLGLVDGPLPGPELPAYTAPVELRRDILRGGEVLASPGELARFVVAPLSVQDVAEQARRG